MADDQQHVDDAGDAASVSSGPTGYYNPRPSNPQPEARVQIEEVRGLGGGSRQASPCPVTTHKQDLK